MALHPRQPTQHRHLGADPIETEALRLVDADTDQIGLAWRGIQKSLPLLGGVADFPVNEDLLGIPSVVLGSVGLQRLLQQRSGGGGAEVEFSGLGCIPRADVAFENHPITGIEKHPCRAAGCFRRDVLGVRPRTPAADLPGGVISGRELPVWHAPVCGEGRNVFAHVHVGTMESASPSLIGIPWASAERSPPLLDVGDVLPAGPKIPLAAFRIGH